MKMKTGPLVCGDRELYLPRAVAYKNIWTANSLLLLSKQSSFRINRTCVWVCVCMRRCCFSGMRSSIVKMWRENHYSNQAKGKREIRWSDTFALHQEKNRCLGRQSRYKEKPPHKHRMILHFEMRVVI